MGLSVGCHFLASEVRASPTCGVPDHFFRPADQRLKWSVTLETVPLVKSHTHLAWVYAPRCSNTCYMNRKI